MPSTNKEKYRQLCQEQPIPLFMQAWWMDAVCSEGKHWDVLLYKKKEKILGALPFHLIKKLGYKIIVQPVHAQYNGVWINYPTNINEDKKESLEKEVMDNLIDQIERTGIHYFNQNFHHSITNWHPFYWKGFKQTTYYTYQIKDISNVDEVYNSFSHAKKKQIKKASKNFIIDFSMDLEEFHKLHTQYLLQDGKKIWYSKTLFKSIYQASVSRDQGTIIRIRDENNNMHAALFLVWDKQTAYNLISVINPEYKSSGASTRIVWEAIKILSNKTTIFDFEGSMIKGVARSFQQFGTEQVPYFNIEKSYSKTLALLLKIKKH
jgi:hypothetical protein